MRKYYNYLIWFGLIALIYGCNVKPGETELQCNKVGTAEILNIKNKYKAGDPINMEVQTEGLEEEVVLIVWDGKFGEQYFEKTIYSEDFTFAFPDSISIYSGFVTIKIIHCQNLLSKKKIYISSLHPVGAIEAYLGPKTLAIDQNMQSMLCLIPKDKYGNALEESDSIHFSTKYRNMDNIKVKKGIENLLSFIKIKNNRQVGKVLLGAKCEDTYIDEQEVAIVEGPMQEVKINILELHPYSDQRQIVHLNTDVILDELGNIVADGTSVIFVVYEKGEIKAQYQTYTVSGIANIYIENPKKATTWDVSIVGAPKSSEIQLTFYDNLESIPLRIEKEHLVVGPVVGSLDQYIPDGTEVSVTFNYTIHKNLQIEHGFARLKIPETILKLDEIICEVEINNQKVKMIY